MAVTAARLSGTMMLTSPSNTITTNFSNLLNVSALITLDFMILPNVSDFIVSLAQFSNCNVVLMQSDNVVRVNFGNVGAASYVSNASAGFTCTTYLWMGSSISGPNSVRFANSGANSATIRLTLCTS